MTIVSVMEGMKLQVMKQFNAMGTNRIEIQNSYRQGLACFFG